MHLKLLQKKQFKTQRKQLVIWLVKKLIGNKITNVSKTLQQNRSNAVTNET